MQLDHETDCTEWLGPELRRALKLTEGATKSEDVKEKDLYLAGLEQLLTSLHNHYRTDDKLVDHPQAFSRRPTSKWQQFWAGMKGEI